MRTTLARVLIRDRFADYITWDQFEDNQQTLQENGTLGKMLAAPRGMDQACCLACLSVDDVATG